MYRKKSDLVKNFRSMLSTILFNLILVIVLIYALPKVAERSYKLARDFVEQSDKENSNEIVSKQVDIVIPSGASTSQIAKILEENGLVSNADLFTIKVKFSEYDGTFKKGSYSLDTSMTDEEIMEILKKGTLAQNDITFTIPEGYTILKIADKLEKEGIVTAQEFIDAANNGDYDYDFIKDLPGRASRLEGYLFPDTYYFRTGVTAEEIVSKLLARFDEIYTDTYASAANSKNYTMDQVMTMASIVEKEAKLQKEQAIIAGVINNRLEIGMALQMDSTVNYAFELRDGVNSGRDEQQVLLTDLEIESDYNTYANAGLPIGPICNPGKNAIEAVLFPEHHKYIYFVLKDAATGEHEFSETYEQHLAAKRKYQ